MDQAEEHYHAWREDQRLRDRCCLFRGGEGCARLYCLRRKSGEILQGVLRREVERLTVALSVVEFRTENR